MSVCEWCDRSPCAPTCPYGMIREHAEERRVLREWKSRAEKAEASLSSAQADVNTLRTAITKLRVALTNLSKAGSTLMKSKSVWGDFEPGSAVMEFRAALSVAKDVVAKERDTYA